MSNGQTPPIDLNSLSPVELVRSIPEIMLDTPREKVLARVFWIAVEHAINETIVRHGNTVDVVIRDEAIIIKNNGEGFPIEKQPDTNISTLENILTNMHIAYAPFKLHELINGPGIMVINALSAELSVEIRRDQFLWRQTYRRGVPQTDLERIRELTPNDQTGTTFTFSPDYTVIKPFSLDHLEVQRRLREYAFLIPGLMVTFTDERNAVKTYAAENFNYPNGVQEFVEFINRNSTSLDSPVIVDIKREDAGDNPYQLNIAVQFAADRNPFILGFINGFEIEYHSTYIAGLILGLRKAIYKYLYYVKGIKSLGFKFDNHDISSCLTAVMSIWHPAPKFSGLMQKEILIYPDLEALISRSIDREMEAFYKNYPDQMETIVQTVMKNRELRLHRRYGD